MRHFVVLFALISASLSAQQLMNQGIAAFKQGRYQEAVDIFSREAAAHPNDVNPHLYLGTAYQTMWIPGAMTPENERFARGAETEFRRVLELDANDKTALASLGAIAYKSALSLQGDQKTHRYDEAMEWYRRLATVDPMNKEAPYSIGVIAWAKWYPALMSARASVRMRPEDPGPLPGPVREELRSQYSTLIEDGIANLNRALQLDPHYSNAMAYMNLLIRERADLRESKEEYAADIASADKWVVKALDEKRTHPQSDSGLPTPAPPPPPPPPAGVGGGGGMTIKATPMRIRVGGMIQENNLIKKVTPEYPPLAKEAHISGQVRFTVVIAKDGSVQNAELVSGHPLLVAAAMEAVKQWFYKSTLLNGAPVEVVTQVDVNFVAGN